VKICFFPLMPYRFPRPPVTTLPGGHMRHLESPEAVARAITRLSS
jgi:hypothetical protein